MLNAGSLHLCIHRDSWKYIEKIESIFKFIARADELFAIVSLFLPPHIIAPFMFCTSFLLCCLWWNIHVHIVGFVRWSVGRRFFQILGANFLLGIVVSCRFSFGTSVGSLVSGRFSPTVRWRWRRVRWSTLRMAARFTFRTGAGASAPLFFLAWCLATTGVRGSGLFAITRPSTAPSSGLLFRGKMMQLLILILVWDE